MKNLLYLSSLLFAFNSFSQVNVNSLSDYDNILISKTSDSNELLVLNETLIDDILVIKSLNLMNLVNSTVQVDKKLTEVLIEKKDNILNKQYLNLSNENSIQLLVKAIQEQKIIIDNLSKRVEILETKLRNIR